jgi:hypothetical protein
MRDTVEEANNLKCNVPLSECQTNENRAAVDTWKPHMRTPYKCPSDK